MFSSSSFFRWLSTPHCIHWQTGMKNIKKSLGSRTRRSYTGRSDYYLPIFFQFPFFFVFPQKRHYESTCVDNWAWPTQQNTNHLHRSPRDYLCIYYMKEMSGGNSSLRLSPVSLTRLLRSSASLNNTNVFIPGFFFLSFLAATKAARKPMNREEKKKRNTTKSGP